MNKYKTFYKSCSNNERKKYLEEFLFRKNLEEKNVHQNFVKLTKKFTVVISG